MAKHLLPNWKELSDEELLSLKNTIERDLDRIKAQDVLSKRQKGLSGRR